MKAHERLLKYVSYRTPSDENSDTSPSSRCQFELAHELVNELKALGVADAECDEYCYVYGHIPATPGKENATAIGFCAHMDTVSDYCDHDANPQIVENYDGEALPLGDSGLVLDPEVCCHAHSHFCRLGGIDLESASNCRKQIYRWQHRAGCRAGRQRPMHDRRRIL